VTKYDMKETSYGASYTGFVDRLTTSGKRQAAKQARREGNQLDKQDDFTSNVPISL